MREIDEWLKGLGLGQYAALFAENDVDLEVLPHLTDQELKELGVSLGHRKKLQLAITALSDQAPSEAAPDVAAVPASTPTAASTEAERRQLTVMFCDLVGSTALSVRLDPEDLRDVMRRYQDAVAGAVTRYDGHIAKYLGDGVLACFGWPRAHEDQAKRAVRGGLDALRALQALLIDDGSHMAARAGIATGRVVVGDLVGEVGREAEAITGEAPNLAARLRQVARLGQVVIGATTRRPLGQAFDLEDLGRHHLKGFAAPVPAWRVSGVRAWARLAQDGEAAIPAAIDDCRWAMAVAERQQSRTLQLRAAVDLARLWRDRGRRREARELLAPTYAWFTEGFDTPDQRESKSLLAELG